MKKFLYVVFAFTFTSSFSQVGINEVDFSKITQKKIVNFIQAQKRNYQTFVDLCPSWFKEDDTSLYNKHQIQYLIKANPDIVWEAYKSAKPQEAWNGKHYSFGILYSKQANKIVYANTRFNGINIGQIYFLNFKIFRGIINLALAFEIITIDDNNKMIEFSYIDGGKTNGKQIVELHRTSEGYTEIIHSTYFKSDSEFRDKRLYPFFHKNAIKEFHRNIKRNIRHQQKTQNPSLVIKSAKKTRNI